MNCLKIFIDPAVWNLCFFLSIPLLVVTLNKCNIFPLTLIKDLIFRLFLMEFQAYVLRKNLGWIFQIKRKFFLSRLCGVFNVVCGYKLYEKKTRSFRYMDAKFYTQNESLLQSWLPALDICSYYILFYYIIIIITISYCVNWMSNVYFPLFLYVYARNLI